MYLNDSEMMLLEQLAYLNDNVYKASGVSKISAPKTIEEMLSVFTDEALEELENNPKYNPKSNEFIQASEWAATIRAIKQSNLKDLEIKDAFVDSGNTLALCFCDPNDSNSAYVAFKGTTGGTEWYDNAEGLYQTDTECQKDALRYIESLPYNDITVVGHSKGGNKAMYVAILSDKVNRCIAMDGQGFSKEFLEKYWAEIEQKGSIITNYSLNDDYVHILLSQIPNSKQVYCEGYNDANEYNGLDNHSPNSYFEYEKVDGKAQVKYDKNKNPKITETSENVGLTYLAGFTTFINNTMPKKDKEKISDYVGIILALALGSGKTFIHNGKTYYKDKMLEYVFSNEECFAILFAYLVKYIATFDVSEEEIKQLLEAFGLGDFFEELKEKFEKYGISVDSIKDLFVILLDHNLSDLKHDGVIELLLNQLKKYLRKKGIKDFDIVKAWRKAEAEYIVIGTVDKSADQTITTRKSITRDFSVKNYDSLIDAMTTFSKTNFLDVSSWKKYGQYSWFSALFIGVVIRGINTYIERLAEVNSECKKRVKLLFKNIEIVDNNNYNSLEINHSVLKETTEILNQLNEKIVVHK